MLGKIKRIQIYFKDTFTMKKKIKYSKGEIGKVEIINDFLPAPKDLILKGYMDNS
ncbi:MAG: hypothetical protein RL662_273 [Bacteroidota bacterium]|jgi:hypothetical protein